MQMVEDDTDEVYGEQELDYDEHILTQLMLRMRINLETFLAQDLTEGGTRDHSCDVQGHGGVGAGAGIVRDQRLVKQINTFAEHHCASLDFVDAMHIIRQLGNSAAHGSLDGAKQTQQECEEAVRAYRHHKEVYDINKSKAQTIPTNPNTRSQVQQTTSADVPGGTSSARNSQPDGSDEKKAGRMGKGGIRNDSVDASTTMAANRQRKGKCNNNKKKKK
jgi:hypothetical protein